MAESPTLHDQPGRPPARSDPSADVLERSHARAAGRRTQAERSASTRAALLGRARELFAADGYAATGLDRVVARAGVTRGAFYHHFASKAELFAAVVEAIDEEFSDEVTAAAGSGDDIATMIHQGARAYIDVSCRAENNRILADAASVLGPEAYRAISAAHCLDLVRLAIDAAGGGGSSLPGDPDVLAAMLLGALNEAVLYLARDPGSQSTKESVIATVGAVLDRLLDLEPSPIPPPSLLG